MLEQQSSVTSRNRNAYSVKRKTISNYNTNVIHNNVLRDLENKEKGTPHTVIELSGRQWTRISNNSIVCEGLSDEITDKKHPVVSYDKVTIGSNISTIRRKFISNKKRLQCKIPLLSRIKGSFLAIVGKKDDILATNNKVLVVDGSSQELGNNENNKGYKASGMVLLCLVTLKKDRNETGYTWGKREATFLKSCKSNIMTGRSHHFSSTGNYYSYGNRDNFGRVHNSTITQYVSKKYASIDKTKVAKENAEIMEDLSTQELAMGIKYLSAIIPNVKKYIAPTLNAIHRLQDDIGDININEVQGTKSELWTTSICDTCQTTNFHTENDCTYTVVTVPKQEKNSTCNPEYNFLFDLKMGQTIGIKMEHGVTCMYTGRYLMHRQCLNESAESDNDTFLNFASYGNERLYNHHKSSVSQVYN